MDRVSLSLPDTPAYLPLMRLILGGIAARRNMSFDAMDDLQLAVENVMAGRHSAERRITMLVELADDHLELRVGSLHDETLRCELSTHRHSQPPEALDTCLILQLLVDEYEIEEEPQGTFAVRLKKQCQ